MGTKGKLFPHAYKPASGVKEDFEDLLQRFIATETVRYENFVEIWRDMKMPLIFAGRQTEREAREFTEECFRIAMQYALSPYNFQVRVGALYLLYGLFNVQPVMHRARIRITHPMWLDLSEFQTEAHRQQHLDVDYVFHKLRYQNAFIFPAMQSEVVNPMEKTKEDVSLSEEFKEEQSVLFDLFSVDTLEQMATVHQHYEAIKVALEGPQATKPSQSLSVIKQELVPGITKAITMYQERQKVGNLRRKLPVTQEKDIDTENGSDSQEDGDNRDQTSKKLRLKEKAFARATGQSQRFRKRKASAMSESETEESPKKKSPKTLTKTVTIKTSEVPATVKMLPDSDTEEQATEKGLCSMPMLIEESKEQESPKKRHKKKSAKKSRGPKLVVTPLPAYSDKVESPEKGRDKPMGQKVKKGSLPSKGRGRPKGQNDKEEASSPKRRSGPKDGKVKQKDSSSKGRGRPKTQKIKVEDSSAMEQGRPDSENLEEEISLPKGRGRPEGQNVEDSVSRGHGRPEGQNVEDTVSRGRGRPRGQNVKDSVSRGRGRPRGQNIEDSVSRGRGRPRGRGRGRQKK